MLNRYIIIRTFKIYFKYKIHFISWHNRFFFHKIILDDKKAR